jgi:hypothetical protein
LAQAVKFPSVLEIARKVIADQLSQKLSRLVRLIRPGYSRVFVLMTMSNPVVRKVLRR